MAPGHQRRRKKSFITLTPWQSVEPGQVEFSQGKPGQVPGVEGGAHYAATVRHVVQQAPGWVAPIDVQHVGEPVLPLAFDGVVVRLK